MKRGRGEAIMSTRSKLLGVIIAVAVIAVGITSGIIISHMVKTDPRRAMLARSKMPVTAAETKVETINDVIGASGQTQQIEKVTLTAKISQPVLWVKTELGATVKKGQALVGFEQKVMKAAVAEAEERLNKARANLEHSGLNYQRFLNLYRQNLIAKADVEKMDGEVKNARWELAAAEQQLQKAKQDMDYTILSSSVNGVVLERPVNPGETPKADAPLVTLGIIDDIFMLAKVAEEKISYVRLKQDAEVIFDSFPNDAFKGEIVRIDPNVDPKTRTFIAYVKIPNKELKLTPGLTGFARIRNRKTALAVPTVSVMNPVGEGATVLVVGPDSVAHIRRVKTGVSADGFTEIREGLKEGDRVVTAGAEFLRDGDRVNVMEGRP